MKLSAIIKQYREEHSLSQRKLAEICGLSNSYISFIENERNPRTGKPIVPTLEQYKRLADAMNISVHSLFEMLDSDSPVDISAPPANSKPLSSDESYLVDIYRKASPESRKNAVLILESSAREREALKQEYRNLGSA